MQFNLRNFRDAKGLRLTKNDGMCGGSNLVSKTKVTSFPILKKGKSVKMLKNIKY